VNKKSIYVVISDAEERSNFLEDVGVLFSFFAELSLPDIYS